MRKALIGQELRNLRWKSKAWQAYMDGKISYVIFKEECRLVANIVRSCCGESSLTEYKFDEAWQYMTVGHENYRKAYSEFLRVIMLDY